MTQHPALALKALIDSGRLVRAPGAYDALSARLVERAGFEAVYMTGFGATASRIGLLESAWERAAGKRLRRRTVSRGAIAAPRRSH